MRDSTAAPVSPTSLRLHRRFEIAARLGAGAVVLLGAVGLVGWALEIPLLTSVHPSLASMKANAALLFVLLGVAVGFTAKPSSRRTRRVLAIVAGVVALLTLAEYAFGLSLGIDQLLFIDEHTVAANHPGRMAPATAFSFLFVAVAVLLLDVARLGSLQQISILVPTLLAFLTLCAYIFQVSSLYAVLPFTSVALHTAIGLLVLCASVVWARPADGFMKILGSDTDAGKLMRRLLPVVVVIPPALGWMRLAGQRAGLYDTSFGVALLVIANVGSLAMALWWIASARYPLELERESARGALVSSDARTKAILDSALDAVVTIDHLGAIAEFNPAAERMFGHRRADVLGLTMADVIVPPRLRDAHHRGFARYLGTGEAHVLGKVVELSALRSDGTEFPVELAITRVEGETPPLFTGFIRDLTERQRGVERFRLVIEAAPTGMIMVDAAGRIVLVNALVERLFGYQRADLIGQSIEILIPPRFRAGHPALRQGFFSEPHARPMGAGRDLYGLRRDGTELPIEIGLNPIETAEGKFVLSSIVDITARKSADDERARLLEELTAFSWDLEARVEAGTWDVRENEARYRQLFDGSPIALWEEDFTEAIGFLRELQASISAEMRGYLATHPDTVVAAMAKVRLVAVNRRCLELFQASNDRELGEGFSRTFGPGSHEVFADKLISLLQGRASFEAETIRRTLGGRLMTVSLRSTMLGGALSRVIDSMVDITETREAERRLQESFHKQEVLLKEIHHRVKNNLAVISSLFYLESISTTDEQTARVFEESQRRVRSMALVHETLYGSQDLSEIDFAEYARVLAAELLATYSPQGGHIRLTTDVQTVTMSIDQAVPCGLILNELISNAFKHAFPEERSGTIGVTVGRLTDRRCLICVSDDGVGLPANLNIETHSSLGLRLIKSLVRQVRGTFDLVPQDPGTQARLTVELEADDGKGD